MRWRPPRLTLTDTLFPLPSLFRSAIWFIWQATNVPEPPRNIVVGPQTFPILAGLLMLAVSVPLLLQRLRVHRRACRQPGETEEHLFVPGDDDEVSIRDRKSTRLNYSH